MYLFPLHELIITECYEQDLLNVRANTNLQSQYFYLLKNY